VKQLAMKMALARHEKPEIFKTAGASSPDLVSRMARSTSSPVPTGRSRPGARADFGPAMAAPWNAIAGIFGTKTKVSGRADPGLPVL
jgi:hypothetical protein